ncbi:MAG: helix-turn-helix domain-containing protein [Deltaproteobacteria bacterium]|nr:helix-turn-helix domain-containing protein [Deltaproteobacteria bacterium]
MAKEKLESEAVKMGVVKAVVAGQSQEEIGRTLGVSQSTISRLINKKDVKDLLEAETLKLLESVPAAVENIRDLVEEMKRIPKKEVKRRELSYKATIELLKTAGLLPTPLQAQTLINIYKTQNLILTPIVQKMIDHMLQPVPEPEEPDYNAAD